MRKWLIVLGVAYLSIGAAAAHRHHQHYKHDREYAYRSTAHAWGVNWGVNNNIVSVAGRYLGGNPTGWAHVWCGEFMGIVVRQAGYQPPRGFALARNWAHFGHEVSPGTPGSIMVMSRGRRGGHVGVVLANLGGGRVMLRSGNHGHRVADGVYPMSRAIAWRAP